jgi:peptide deformylase
MAILEVLKFPNPRLREISKPVTKFDAATKARLAKLAEDMFETMYEENGVGLAAPQVGELVRMVIVDARPKDKQGRYKIEDLSELEKAITQPMVIINPVITKHEGKTTFDEGCLSVPTFYETVERFEYIELDYHDLEGNKYQIKTDGFLAIVIQHEMDHLEGTLFIDHLSLIKSNKIKNQIKKHGYPEKKNQENETESDDQEDSEL